MEESIESRSGSVRWVDIELDDGLSRLKSVFCVWPDGLAGTVDRYTVRMDLRYARRDDIWTFCCLLVGYVWHWAGGMATYDSMCLLQELVHLGAGGTTRLAGEKRAATSPEQVIDCWCKVCHRRLPAVFLLSSLYCIAYAEFVEVEDVVLLIVLLSHHIHARKK